MLFNKWIFLASFDILQQRKNLSNLFLFDKKGHSHRIFESTAPLQELQFCQKTKFVSESLLFHFFRET